MRIAVSGTHFIGKSTLIEDFIKQHPEYKCELEPLNESASKQNIIFDRCPVDFMVYAMWGESA